MPIFLIPVGVAMMAAAMSRKKKRSKETGLMKTPEIILPSTWDEGEITRGLERHRGDEGLLGAYIDGIISRFVLGQNTRTIAVRMAFLKTLKWTARLALCQRIRDTLDRESIWDEARSTSLSRW